MRQLAYHRLLVKLSGESLSSANRSIDSKKLALIGREFKVLHRLGVEVAVVIGGGNLWRKRRQGQAIDPVTADFMGMLATVMNALALKQALVKAKVPCVLQSPLAADVQGVNRLDAVAARGSLRRGEVVVYPGATGQAFLTSDTAAAQRAKDLHVDVLVKASQVDGVYTADPREVKQAKKYKELTIKQALRRKLKVMDKEAFEICAQAKLLIVVCKWGRGVLAKVALGRRVGTLVMP